MKQSQQNKILFLAHSQSIHVQRWVRFFVKKKWEVHVVSFHPHKIDGTMHHYLKSASIRAEGNNFQYIFKLRSIIHLVKQINPDIINSHFLSSFGLIAYFTRYPNQVINAYGTDVFINSVKNPLMQYLCKKALHRAKRIIAVSQRMTEFLVQKFSIPQEKIITTQYGIDLHLFQNKVNMEDRPYDFIVNRLFVKNSNYDFILQSIRALKRNKKDVKLLIVGSGPLKKHIARRIQKYGLSGNVTLLDAVPAEKMAELLNSARVFLSFTTSDGTPLSLFEAMACGLYPVLSNIDAYREWKNKGMDCELVPLSDVDETAKKMKAALKKCQITEYTNANIKIVRKYMDYQKNMEQIERLFKQVISDSQ